VIVALPAATPITLPPELTEATDGLLVDQTPPETVDVKLAEAPEHMESAPETIPGLGEAVTITLRNTVVEQPPEVTV
jgi:hypothetical protein